MHRYYSNLFLLHCEPLLRAQPHKFGHFSRLHACLSFTPKFISPPKKTYRDYSNRQMTVEKSAQDIPARTRANELSELTSSVLAQQLFCCPSLFQHLVCVSIVGRKTSVTSDLTAASRPCLAASTVSSGPPSSPVCSIVNVTSCNKSTDLLMRFSARHAATLNYLRTYHSTIGHLGNRVCWAHSIWGHSGPLCHALSLLMLLWTSMRRRRATVATPGELRQ